MAFVKACKSSDFGSLERPGGSGQQPDLSGCGASDEVHGG